MGLADLAAALVAPVLLVIRLIAAGAFLASSYGKFRDLQGARVAVLDYRLVPVRVATPVATGLAVSEFTAGILLLLGSPAGSALGVALLALFTIAVGSALLRGLDISCHCVDEEEPIGSATILRNVVLMVGLGAEVLARGSAPFAATTLDEPLERVLAAALLLAAGIVVYGTVLLATARAPQRVGGSTR